MTVRQLQLLLSYLDYSPGEIDGVAGEKTKSAVEAFQRAEGLAADGEAGVKTQEKLKEAVFRRRSASGRTSAIFPGTSPTLPAPAGNAAVSPQSLWKN